MTGINELLDEIDRRLFELQTYLSSDEGLGNNTFDKIVIVDGATNYTIDTVVSPPTVLTITPGTFVDRIYADVGWTAPVDATAVSYDVEWAKRNGAGPYTYELVDGKRVGGNTIRLDNLLPHQWYGVRVYSINHLGIRAPVPATGFQDFQTSGDSSAPGSPAGLTVFAAIRSLIATWNDNAETDVTFGAGTYRVQVSTNSGFTGVIKDSVVSGTIATFVDLTAATSYYVRVAAIDSSGNQGPWTAGVSNTTGQVGLADMAVNSVGANQVIANSIATTHIATVGLDAGVVKFGTLDGNLATIIHLKANNIDTSSITTSTITLNGGSLQAGSPPTTGLLINSQGMRLYSGGTAVIIFDAPSGSATLAGNITSTATITGGTLSGSTINGGTIVGGVFKTATSGARVEMNTSLGINSIFFYTGSANESQAGQIQGYQNSTSPFNQVAMNIYSPRVTGGGGGVTIQLTDDQPSASSTFYVAATNITLNGITSLSSVLAMNDQQIRLRASGDVNNRINYVSTEGTPSNGLQTVNGPMIRGAEATGLGGSPTYGMLFRCYANAGTLRNDSWVDLNVWGSFFVSGSKTFRIDHPVLGDSHYLTFSSIEGPRADLIYRGTITLDKTGAGQIDLDDYYGMTPGTFDKLNLKTGRQSLVWKEGGVDSSLTWELDGSILSVQGKPNSTLGWMVITERGDPSIRAAHSTDTKGHLINEQAKTKFELEYV